MNNSEKINPMYEKNGHSIESEIKRMNEFEWPLEVSAEILPKNLDGKIVADIGAGPNTNLGKIVEQRGGKYIALDRNFKMTGTQKQENKTVQGDIFHLPFRDKEIDILHTRFVVMNIPENKRAEAICELARSGKQNIIMDYDWKSFHSENPEIQTFAKNARQLAEMAGTDLYFGGKLKKFIESILGEKEQIKEIIKNQGEVKNYDTLARLAHSMQGLAKNLKNTELELAMKNSEAQFQKEAENPNKENVIPFTQPDIVAVIF